jgi:hypothetical protein
MSHFKAVKTPNPFPVCELSSVVCPVAYPVIMLAIATLDLPPSKTTELAPRRLVGIIERNIVRPLLAMSTGSFALIKIQVLLIARPLLRWKRCDLTVRALFCLGASGRSHWLTVGSVASWAM